MPGKFRVEFKFWARSTDGKKKNVEVRKFDTLAEAAELYKETIDAFLGDQSVLGSVSLYTFIEDKKKTFCSTTIY